ncbi:hypothetical protein CAEBREN_17825 [Caenorhabditis brenneri]|uniref:Transmembrane protein n=1 Tax=Caenorhabditis brenneri TaxID=135651 RepID=G0MA78_CAEBE|nr:hypothetical protein CAEBREN_17825 [Caenorhabditis brenneri]
MSVHFGKKSSKKQESENNEKEHRATSEETFQKVNFMYVFVTIVAALVLKRLIIFVWYCISSLGDWFIGNFENTRIDDLPSRCRMAATEEPNSEELVHPDKLSCECPRVEAGNSSGTSRTMEQNNNRDVKDFEDSMKRIVEGKDKEEDVRTM